MNSRNRQKLGLLVFLTGFSGWLCASGAIEGAIEKQPLNITAIFMFVIFALSTLGITWWAAQRSQSRADFYAAGGAIPAWQNGIAISGDFLSAATFLGITSAVYFGGFDGLLFAAGVMMGWPIILFLIAEPLRNLGRYTFIDVVSYRLKRRPVTILAAVSSLVVVIFYLIAQLVGAGKLIQLLFGVDYIYAVICVSLLMILYVSFGGMLATTWVQFIKAILLIFGGTLIAFLVMKHFGFSLNNLLKEATQSHKLGQSLLAPGNLFNSPGAIMSLAITSLFGFMGLPHILMRLFTVNNAKAARMSAFYSIAIMGYFYVLIMVIGFGAVPIIMDNPDYHNGQSLIGGGNMVVLHLSHFIGGNMLLGFISAVTFATILAVVSGLTMSGAATIAHDLYTNGFAKKEVSEAQEVWVSRISVLVLGLLSIALGIAFEHQNVVFVATMSLAIAGSVNAPILLMSIYWKGLTTRGAIVGGIAGLVLSVGLIVVGPQIWVAVLGFDEPIYPYTYPTMVSAPVAFIVLWLVSITDRSRQAEIDRAGMELQFVKSETGLGIADASAH